MTHHHADSQELAEPKRKPKLKRKTKSKKTSAPAVVTPLPPQPSAAAAPTPSSKHAALEELVKAGLLVVLRPPQSGRVPNPTQPVLPPPSLPLPVDQGRSGYVVFLPFGACHPLIPFIFSVVMAAFICWALRM
jgi:hypothetical protein